MAARWERYWTLISSIAASIVKVIVSYEIANAGFNTNVDPDLTVSTILYWSMIEGGLAIIAACLPTLRFLVGKLSLDSIVNSVRNVLTLESKRSRQSQQSTEPSEGPYTNIYANTSSTSHSQMVRSKEPTDVFVMGNIDVSQAAEHDIFITRQISQHSSMV